MIRTRLMKLVPDAKKYIAYHVLLQWFGMLCSIGMVVGIADFLRNLSNQETVLVERYALWMLTVIILRIAFVKLAALASYHASRNVKRTLRGLIYQKVLALGSSYMEHVPTAEVVQLAGEGVEQLETYFGNYLPQLFYALLAPITLFMVVNRISPKVAWVLLLCVPLIPISIIVVQKIAKKLLSKYWGQYAALGDHFLENLQGLTTLKIYQADEARHQMMNQEAEYFRVVTMKVLSMQLNSIIIMDLVAYGGAALGILLAIVESRAGRIDLFGGIIILLLSAEFFLPMRLLGSFFHVAMNGMAASDKIFRLLDLPSREPRSETPTSNYIEIQDLQFSYNDEKTVLTNINLIFPQNRLTALVGESGSGKSTIASILSGKHDRYTGRVMIGGKELSQIAEQERVNRITLIGHNSYLFKGTVRENLLVGKTDALDDELWGGLERVNLAGFVRSAGGLDLRLTEAAGNLSGGQRQRLALARALLYDSPVYIFDEATSSVDVESENDIMHAIHQLSLRKTVILISHRLANIVRADQIYVLKDGKVVESGNHQALLSHGGVYHSLWEGQQALEAITKEETNAAESF